MAVLLSGTTIGGNVALHAGNVSTYGLPIGGGTLTGQLNLHAGSYEGSIVFGSVSTWRTGIRQHDDADAELRIWAKNANGMIFIATGYDGEPADISRPTDGLAIQGNKLGIGNFSTADPSYKLHVKGDIYANGGWVRVSGSEGLYFESYGGGWRMTDSTWIRAYNDKNIYTGGSIEAGGSVRADSGVIDSNRRFVIPGGASTVNHPSGTGGAIRINLPTATYGSNTMMSMTVHVYEYSTGQSFTIRCGGYNYYTHDWYNVFAYLLNDSGKGGDVPVYFGNDGTRDVIWIGNPEWSWSYPNVFVTDFQAGHSQSESWKTGWSISFDTAARTNVSASRTAYRQIDTGTIGSQSVSYATTSGSTTGNAATATTLATARTLTIGNTGKTFNGSANVSWTLAEIGAQAAGNYLTSFTETNAFLGDGGNGDTHPGTSRLIFTGQLSQGTDVLGMPTTDNSNAFLNINRHSGEYNSQLGFSSNGNMYYRSFSNAAINSTQAWRTVWDSGNLTNLNQLTNGPGYITGNQTITLSGDVSGSGTTSIAVTVNNIDGWGFVNTGSNSATNADTINSNGISYYTGGVTNFSGNATDGALYSQRYSDAWQHQIAGDYRSGQIALRGKNNGTWQAWRTVLDSSNFSTWAAAASHTHTIANVTGLQAALDGKQAAGSYLTDGGYYDHRTYTRADNYLGGYYVSGGSEKPNNAIFGAGKLKVAMLSGSNLGFGGSWNDVLWMSTYNGGDVKASYAIVGDKYADELYFSRQNFDSAAWGTGRRIWHSGNFDPNSKAASTHTHAISDVTGLQTALDGKQASGSYAAASHTHDDRYYTETESDGRFLKLDGGTTTGTVVMNGDNYLNGSLSSIKNIHYQYSGIGYTVTNGAAAWYRIAKLDNFGAGILILGFTNNGAINEVIYEITYWLGEGDNATIDLRKFGVDDYVTEARIVKNNSLYYIEAYFAAAPTTPQTYHSPEIFNVRTLGTNINKVITVYTGNLSVTSGTQTTLVGKAFIDNGNTFSVENATSTLAGLAVHSGRNNEANKIVRTQGNGYVDFGWINTTSGNTTSTITDVYVNTNDGYIRKATPAHFRSQITDGVYAPVSHTHTIANVTGLQTALDGKQAAGSYAAASHTHTFASLTSTPTTISGYGITDAITTGNIGSQSVSRASGVSITGFGTDSFTYHQTPGNVHSWTGGWASHFIGNHGNGDTYYSQSIIMPFWGVPRYQRNEGGNKVGPWQFITEENIATQSVSFATTSGSATSSTTANRLDNYGINYGSDWNTWGVYGKLVASSFHNASGANRPPTYTYGSFLSFLNAGSDSFQIAIPENQWNGTGKERAMHFRSAWNGTWSYWRQVVDIQNNICDILADGTSTLIVRQGVGYNQPFNSNIEIHGSVDDWAYGKFRFRVQDDPGSIPVYGAQFRIERFSVNTGWQLLGMVPRGSQNLEWQGDILPGLSDQRVKENVVSLANGVATVQQINPVEFDWKPVENVSEREGHDIGFIAQQLEEIVPTAVYTRNDGYKTVKYEKVVPILVQAVKEQQSLIEQLTARIEALENR